MAITLSAKRIMGKAIYLLSMELSWQIHPKAPNILINNRRLLLLFIIIELASK